MGPVVCNSLQAGGKLPGRAQPHVLGTDSVLSDILDAYFSLHYAAAVSTKFDTDFLAASQTECILGIDIKADAAGRSIIEPDFLFLGVSEDYFGWTVGCFAPILPVVDSITGRFSTFTTIYSAPISRCHFEVSDCVAPGAYCSYPPTVCIARSRMVPHISPPSAPGLSVGSIRFIARYLSLQ